MSADSARDFPEITYSGILDLLTHSDWPMATTEVGEHFGVDQQVAYYRLNELKKRGEVEKNLVGGTAVWRPIQESS